MFDVISQTFKEPNTKKIRETVSLELKAKYK